MNQVSTTEEEAAQETRYRREIVPQVAELATQLQSKYEETLTAEEIERICAEVGLEAPYVRAAILQLSAEPQRSSDSLAEISVRSGLVAKASGLLRRTFDAMASTAFLVLPLLVLQTHEAHRRAYPLGADWELATLGPSFGMLVAAAIGTLSSSLRASFWRGLAFGVTWSATLIALVGRHPDLHHPIPQAIVLLFSGWIGGLISVGGHWMSRSIGMAVRRGARRVVGLFKQKNKTSNNAACA